VLQMLVGAGGGLQILGAVLNELNKQRTERLLLT
jgi:hypothetical protein